MFGFYGNRLTFLKETGVQTPTEDALWLSAAVSEHFSGTVLDVGAGTGAVGFSLLSRVSNFVQLTCVEKDVSAYMVSLAHQKINPILSSAVMHHVDFFTWTHPYETFDAVLTNPPFYLIEHGHKSVQDCKKEAHYVKVSDVEDWLQKSFLYVKKEGFLAAILHIDMLSSALEIFKEYTVDIVFLERDDGSSKRFILKVFKLKKAAITLYQLFFQQEDVRTAVLKNAQPLSPYCKKK